MILYTIYYNVKMNLLCFVILIFTHFIAKQITAIVTENISGLSANCSASQFACSNGSNICFPLSYKCDGEFDCEDISDESQCGPCNGDEFKCKDGKCISVGWVCDGDADCLYGEDEGPFCLVSDSCKYFGAPCLSAPDVCIEFENLCDGKVDCLADLSDEGQHCFETFGVDGSNDKLSCLLLNCSYACTILPTSTPTCYCPKGQVLSHLDDTTCEVVDVCSLLNPCEQICTSLHVDWNYECSCHQGFSPSSDDPRLCQPNNGNETPFLITSSEFNVQKIFLNGSLHSSLHTSQRVTALDYDFSNNTVCWISNKQTSELICAHLGNLTISWKITLPEQIRFVSKLAIDWETRNIYIVNSDQLTVCNVTRAPICLMLTQTPHPRTSISSLALDSFAGFLFYGLSGKYGKLMRMDMDGRNQVTLIKIRISSLEEIALDRYGTRVYMFDSHQGSLEACDYNGKNRKQLRHLHVNSQLSSLTFFNSTLYMWSATNQSLFALNPWIYRSQFIQSDVTNVLSMHVVHEYLQRPDSASVCVRLMCDHLCLLGSRINNEPSSSCLCSQGFTLASDSRSCLRPSDDEVFLVYSQGASSTVKMTSLTTSHSFFVPVVTSSGVRAMDYYRDGGGTDWLLISESDSSSTQVSLETYDLRCNSLAVDWLNKNIYWVDGQHRSIHMTTLDIPTADAFSYPNVHRFDPTKVHRRTLTKQDNHMNPRAIAIHPRKGVMFWAVWRLLQAGGIETAWMDGTHKQTFLSDSKISLPTSLVIDYRDDVIYWLDAYQDSIQRISLNKTGRKVLFSEHSDRGFIISHPISIAFYQGDGGGQGNSPSGRFLYWVEYREGQVYRIDLDLVTDSKNLSRDAIRLIAHDQPPLLEALVFDPSSRIGVGSCVTEGCAHYCAPIPTHPFYRCLCPDGEVLLNGTCEVDPNYVPPGPCPEGYFLCTNSRCVLSKWVCDGDNDCMDWSDEKAHLCENLTCPDGDFYCNSSQACVSSMWLCDGDDDCPHGEDEDPRMCERNTCAPDHFSCPSGECIFLEWLCDEEEDCEDGTDEVTNCTLPSCNPGAEFTCRNHLCVSVEWVCDGDDDCGDNSDELVCGLESPANQSDNSFSSSRTCKNPHDILCGDKVTCVPQEWHCDGDVDCIDGADERKCPNVTCQPHSRRCSSGNQCILLSWWCDSDVECPDGSDESNCSCPVIPNHKYNQTRCFTHSRVSSCVNKCDGVPDCLLGTDEHNCHNPAVRISCYEAECSHTCNDTDEGFQCLCPRGKELGDDGITCRDITYCSTPGRCSQICTELRSSYRCSCYPGWHLDPLYSSGGMCSYDRINPPPFLLYMTRHSLKYFPVHLSTAKRGPQVLVKELRHGTAVAFSFRHKLIFYSDVITKTVNKASLYFDSFRKSLRSTRKEVILRDEQAVIEGLAVDWIAERLYHVDSVRDQIGAMDFMGNHRSVVVAGNMDNPRGLSLDPRYGWMFWTVWDKNSARVEKSTLSGLQRSTLCSRYTERNGWLNGLTLDYLEERIYWVDAKFDKMWASNYDGSDCVTILSGVEWLSHPFGITLYAHQLFWTEWHTSVIATADKWPRHNASVFEIVHQKPYDITVFHESRQPMTKRGSKEVIANPCSSAPCGGLCLITVGNSSLSYRCACPHQHQLDPDGHTCRPLGAFLLISSSDIRGLRLDNLNFTAISGVASSGSLLALRLAYDSSRDQIYWSDALTRKMKRVHLNGTGAETISSLDSHNVQGIALDWLRGAIYWTSYKSTLGGLTGSHLYVATLDGRFQYSLGQLNASAWRGITRAAYLTVDVPSAILYFASDEGIHSVRMDGTDLTKISNLSSLSDLRYHNNRLYCAHDGRLSVLYPGTCGSSMCLRDIPLSVRPSLITFSDATTLWTYSRSTKSVYQCKLGDQATCEIRLNMTMTHEPYDVLVYDVADQNRSGMEGLSCASNNGGCQQMCLPVSNGLSPGGSCRCASGYKPKRGNPHLCQGVDELLLFSTGGAIRGINLENPGGALVPIIEQTHASGVDFFAENATMVWSDSMTSTLRASSRDLSSNWEIFSDSGAANVTTSGDSVHRYEGVAVDWMAKNVYWVDSGSNQVKVVRLDGMYPLTVYEGRERMRDVAVHPGRGRLFVSSWFPPGSVTRMRLDGSNPVEVLTKIGWPNGITIDYDHEHLYWCDAENDVIMRSDLSGDNVVQVLSGSQRRAYGITYHEGYLFWSDSLYASGAINACPVFNCTESNVKSLADEFGSTLKGVVVYSKHRQIGSNVCTKDNGGCEHLCFHLGLNTRRCGCSHGILNELDNVTCLAYNRSVLFATQTSIRSIDVDQPSSINEPLPVIESGAGMTSVVAMAVDYENKRVFYGDTVEERIYSFQTVYDGKYPPVPTIVATDVQTVEGLAYHHGEDALYWTSYNEQAIKKRKLGSLLNSATVVVPRSNRSDHLRAIVLYECESLNLMFWTNWNLGDPGVLRANTNGSGKMKIISTGVKTPNGLAIDGVVKHLYWADAKLDKIERCSFEGKNRKVIVAIGLDHVFSLAVLGTFLYWTDWQRDEVLRVNKWTGTEAEVLRRFHGAHVMGVVAYYNDTCRADPCLNVQCEYSCVVSIEGEGVCMCPNGSLSPHCGAESRTCPRGQFNCLSEPSSVRMGDCVPYEVTCDGRRDCWNGNDENPFYCNSRVCRAGYWLCSNNDRCIPAELVCDGFDNCQDGIASDETDCAQFKRAYSNHNCSGDLFECANGRCVRHNWRCDGEDDCGDGSDETCEDRCLSGTFRCDGDGQCIPASFRCDREIDCPDGSDERECGATKCSEHYFRCRDVGRCIRREWYCDGEADCADESDEICDRSSCGGDEFQCNSTLECIDVAWRCDREVDCDDASDESDCEYPECEGLLCSDGRTCVDPMYICDGDPDCRNAADEKNCSTYCDPAANLLCADGVTCLPLSRVCDGVRDCPTLPTDEENCNISECDNPALHKCPQICEERTHSYTCKCYDGYRVDEDDQYSCVDVDECEEANPHPPCSQVCTNTRGSYRCSCTRGYERDQRDPSNCKALNVTTSPFIVTSSSRFVSGFALDGSMIFNIRFSNSSHVIALDFDWLEQKLYWSDIGKSSVSIRRMNMSDVVGLDAHEEILFQEQRTETVHSDLNTVHGLAVDWVARNLYWTEIGLSAIYVSNIDGRFKKRLIFSGLSKPKAIAVDPLKGLLFWSDWGDMPHIGRSGLDGSQQETIIGQHSHAMKMKWPNALTIDYASSRLFWADAKQEFITSCDYDGSRVRTVPIPRIRLTAVHHINALSLFEDRIYWTDWGDMSIKYVNKLLGSNTRLSVINRTSHHPPMDLKVVHPLRQPQPRFPHPCSINNGGCQDLCLMEPGGKYRCECPDNFFISFDGRSCLSNCSYNEFICKNDKCVPFWSRCNLVDDCGDGSDEPKTCPPFHCLPGQYQCRLSPVCINVSAICDGHVDCPEGSDEYNCEKYICFGDDIKCRRWNRSVCLLSSYRCNGKKECDNGEDETHCPSSCPDDKYQCDPVQTGSTTSSILCIPYRSVCDGEKDCSNGDDEAQCQPHQCDLTTMYQCSDHVCIPKSLVHDNHPDCHDGKDETTDSCVNCPGHEDCLDPSLLCDGTQHCADGEDETHCKIECEGKSFKCKSSGVCLMGELQCDGVSNCPDGSDELGCPTPHCQPHHFICPEYPSLCLPSRLRCDGFPDCFDAYDEVNCTASSSAASICPPDMFQCTDSVCVPFRWVCDGVMDCYDSSDEGPYCRGRPCPGDRPIACDHGEVCISSKQLCDGKRDCSTGDDEIMCHTDVQKKGLWLNSSHCQWPPSITHPVQLFGILCPNKACVPLSSICRGNSTLGCRSGYDGLICNQGDCSLDPCDRIPNSVCNPVLSNGSRSSSWQSYCTCGSGYEAYVVDDVAQCVDVNECVMTQPCAQVCVNSPGSYQCSCLVGWSPHNKTGCRSDSSVEPLFVLSASSSSSLKLHIYDQVETQLGFRKSETVTKEKLAIDRIVSPDLGKTFYTYDHLSGALYRIENNVTLKMTQPRRGLRMSGLSLDHTGSILFWINPDQQSVNMMKVSSSLNKSAPQRHFVLFNRNNSVLRWPLDVVDEPNSSHVFVSDGGTLGFPAAIYRLRVPHQTPTSYMKVASDVEWPVSLSVDVLGRRLYWSDSKLRSVSGCNFDGTKRRVIWNARDSQPRLISVFGDFIFATIYDSNAVVRINRLDSSSSVRWIDGRSSRPPGILVLHPSKAPTFPSSCLPCQNTQSVAFCLFDSVEYKCVCSATGGAFQRMTSCPCSELTCSSGSRCVGGVCVDSGANHAAAVGAFLAALIVVIIVAIIAGRKKRFRFCRRLIGRSTDDVTPASYKELVAHESGIDTSLGVAVELSPSNKAVDTSSEKQESGSAGETRLSGGNPPFQEAEKPNFGPRIFYQRGNETSMEKVQLLFDDVTPNVDE